MKREESPKDHLIDWLDKNLEDMPKWFDQEVIAGYFALVMCTFMTLGLFAVLIAIIHFFKE